MTVIAPIDSSFSAFVTCWHVGVVGIYVKNVDEKKLRWTSEI